MFPTAELVAILQPRSGEPWAVGMSQRGESDPAVGTPTFLIGAPGLSFCIHLAPACCWCTPWEAAGSGAWVPVTVWETWLESPAASISPGPVPRVAGIWGVKQWMRAAPLPACFN